MVRSPGFGSTNKHLISPDSGSLSLRLRCNTLSLRLLVTRWIVLQKARRHPEGLRLLVRTQFQVLFHSPSGVLFTFPSRYLFAIDHKTYLALGRGRPSFSQDFSCPDLLEKSNDKTSDASHTGLSPSMV